MALDHKSVVTSPQASMLIWNYTERMSANGLENPHDVDLVYLLTNHIVSISTFKNKGNPTGRFEVTLAPTHNWVARLTPGSWCAINMTKDLPITNPLVPGAGAGLNGANEEQLKWFGRIEDIRMMVEVDQETGARETTYLVTGSDWSGIFESILYVDPVFRGALGVGGDIGMATNFIYQNMLKDYADDKPLPSTTTNVKALLKFWGDPFSAVDEAQIKQDAGADMKFFPAKLFQMPLSVALYMGFGPKTTLADIIEVITGKLTGLDTYTEVEESVGFIEPQSIFGTNSLWSLMLQNCNDVINELVTDLRFEDGSPKLALYKRIKPFVTRTTFDWEGAALVADLVSFFQLLRYTEIPLQDVLSLHAGITNKSIVNFAEVKIAPSASSIPDGANAQFKLDQQTINEPSYQRDGFKPKILSTNYITTDFLGTLDPKQMTRWKYLLREWYFNEANLLNGSVKFMGQNSYIQVGDNIVIDAAVLGRSANLTAEQQQLFGITQVTGQPSMWFMAHVQSVKHNFVANPNTGARSFTTTVDFVRGILVPASNLKSNPISVDLLSTELKSEQEALVDTFTTRSKDDPVYKSKLFKG